MLTEKLPSLATFYGAHYLNYNLSSHGDPIISNNDQISMYFKTRQPNGLLFFTGTGKGLGKAGCSVNTITTRKITNPFALGYGVKDRIQKSFTISHQSQFNSAISGAYFCDFVVSRFIQFSCKSKSGIHKENENICLQTFIGGGAIEVVCVKN